MVALVVGVVAGGAGGWLLPRLLGPSMPDPTPQIQRLQAQVADVAARPAPTAGNSDALTQRLQQSEAALRGEIRSVAQALQELANRPRVVPVDLGPITERLNAIDEMVKAQNDVIRQTVTDTQNRTAALASRIDDAARRVQASVAAPVYVATLGLAQAVQQGRAFANEIAALETLGVAPERLAALKTFAASGVPPVARLAEQFQTLARDLNAAMQARAEGAGGWLQSIVTVRPAGTAPGGALAAIEQAIRAGDLKGALGQLQALPDAQKARASAFIQMLSERVAALDALSALQDAATQGLRRSAP